MTNDHKKFEDPWTMSSLVIDRTRLVYRPTNQPTSAKGGIVAEYTEECDFGRLKNFLVSNQHNRNIPENKTAYLKVR